MDSSTLPAVAEELLREIKKAFQESSHVPDDLLLGRCVVHAWSWDSRPPDQSSDPGQRIQDSLELQLRLKFIFGLSAVPALDLVDQRSVTRVIAPSGRTLYQIWIPVAAAGFGSRTAFSGWERRGLPASAQGNLRSFKLRSLGAQGNSTPATAPATSARALPLGFLCCRRARASCANTSWLST
ncbi:zinc finger SWIM domain-containing protein 7 isoform X3 [Aphelocoma coerulescens]